jgi:hypothetical protein
MEAAGFEPSVLALRHFGKARLWDRRRTRRLVRSAELMMACPEGTLSQKLPDRADLVGLYRLLDCEQVTHAAVLEPHRQRTWEAIGEHDGVVLLIHDPTELDFSHLPELHGQLGQIGNGSRRGYLCHNTLAVGLWPGGRQVLGLASQILHRRREVPADETPRQKRAHPGRESRLWIKGIQACRECGTAQALSAGKLVVDIADRGSDTVEFIEFEVNSGRHFVIRLARDRNLDGDDHFGIGGDRIHRRLISYARDLPVLGRRTVPVPAAPGKHAGRTATVAISSGPLRLRASRFARGQCTGLAMDLWVVQVKEINAPAGIEPLEWMLLTNVPADTFEQACQRVGWYEQRPVIEDYHKGQKTGVSIERSRFEETCRLEPLIALLSVVAVVLLELRDAGRQRDAEQRPATDLVPRLYVEVMAARAARRALEKGPRGRAPVTAQMSVREFVTELAKLGGFMARKSDGLPGWQTLWRGWAKLQLMLEGAMAIVDRKCVHV